MAVRRILVALDVTEGVVREAIRKRANLIVSHHPMLFRPMRTVNPERDPGSLVWQLAKSEIAVVAAHTNLDVTRGGTSFALAETLGIEGAEFLRMSYQVQKKIVTFIPTDDADRVARAMSEAGAGIIGNYDQCSFRAEGVGTFRGNAATSPSVGVAGRYERVGETRLEMAVPTWRVAAVVAALRKEHPYEEPAFDVYPTENLSNDYGMGVVGELRTALSLRQFLVLVRRKLRARSIRYAGIPRTRVKRIALCGGSGSELMDDAARAGAHAFVTADVRYHTFHDAERTGMTIIDAGHHETEFPVVGAIVRRLRDRCPALRGSIDGARISTNPLRTM